MTTPVRGTSRLSAVPASQNTAPVAEFRCLFTHDVRKKQKRWQDGYLKFHSFNSRVIVYDASRFTVGDTYYKDSNELHEGDELMLDKGVMVQVAEPMGVTQTDLTPLFERKTKDSPQPNKAAGPQKPLSRPAISASNPLRAASQLRHKSLNTLLGTPKGPIGKAVPIRSPFEERMEKENQHVEERATKRQKTVHEAPSPAAARELVPKTVPLHLAKPLHINNSGADPRPRAVPHGATVINLSSQPEVDNIPSDVTLPNTPPKPLPMAHPSIVTFVPARQDPLPQQKRAQGTPKLPKGRVPLPQAKAQQTPRPPPPPSSPPVSASNRIANVDFAIQPASDARKEPSVTRSSPNPPQPIEKRKMKSLKLSTRVKRGMLLCQSAPVRRRTSPDEARSHALKSIEDGKHASLQKNCSGPGPHRDNSVKQSAVTMAGIKADTTSPMPPSVYKETFGEGSKQAPLEILDDMELMHGFMDQQLLVTPSPPNLRQSTKPISPITRKTPTTKQVATKKSSKSAQVLNKLPTENLAPKRKSTKTTQNKDGLEKAPVRKKRIKKPEPPVPSRSPSPASVSILAEAPSRDMSLAPSEPAAERLRNTSASVSPRKLADLSTGGFKKRSKRVQVRSVAPEAAAPAPAPRPTTVALPPHPLRSSKNGPLMSTTELSALLREGPKSMRLEDDPIEDFSQRGSNISPSRRSSGFKRSRSENDAPIPSTSDEWEQRNLPKDSIPLDSSKSTPPTTTVTRKSKAGGLAALVKKTDPRRKFQRVQSLSVDMGLANTNHEGPEVVTPPADDDVGPWSTEAFDLFDWRPPGKDWRPEGTKMRLVDAGEEAD